MKSVVTAYFPRMLCGWCCLLAFGLAAMAQDLTPVQEALKAEGFFLGNVDGRASEEFLTALKRFQIRNGLEVTGTLTDETREALGLAGAPVQSVLEPVPQSTPEAQPFQQPAPQSTPRSVRKEAPPREVEETDGTVLRGVPPAVYRDIFRRTPYERAPLTVQRETVLRAQRLLADAGFYEGRLDGAPDRSLQRALASYQNRNDLSETARLDMKTLDEMELLPGESGVPFRRR